jgi:hypothetical protein
MEYLRVSLSRIALALVVCSGVGGCGGGASTSPAPVTPPPSSTSTATLSGQWQIVAHSNVNPASSLLVEANFSQSGSNVTANASSVVLVDGVPGALTGLAGECDNGVLGDDAIAATISGQTVSFTLTETGSLGIGISTGSATISGSQLTGGTYQTPAACGFAADSGTMTGTTIQKFSGTFAGQLLNLNGSTDAVSVTLSQSGYTLNVVGTDAGAPITLTGKVIGATFDVTGVVQGQSREYVGIYDITSSSFLVYNNQFQSLGTLSPQTSAPAPTPISVSVSPAVASVTTSGTQSFTATVTNDTATKGVMWSLSCATPNGCGSLSATTSTSGTAVIYTAPAAAPNPSTVAITATSVSDGTKSAFATITINSPPAAISVSLSQTIATVPLNGTTAFVANVTGDSANKRVSWALSGSECGGPSCGSLSAAVSASGTPITYTGPAAAPSPATVTVTATSVADPTKSASATITIIAGTSITVTVSPITASLAIGGVTQTFTATVQNDSQNRGVTWVLSGSNCNGSTCGSVSPASGGSVTYTSPAGALNAGTVLLTATSVGNNSVSATATITLTIPSSPTASAPIDLGEAAVDEGFGEPVIATDPSGNVDVAWINTGGPEFVRSTNGGQTFSAPVTIPSNMQDTADGNDIQMGVDGSGNINLLWHRELTETGTVPSSFFSRSTDGGMTFSPETNPGGATSAQLVVAHGGNISIIWFDETTSNLQAVSSSDGINFSAPTTIWTAVGNPMDLIVESGPQGQIYLFWTQVVTMTNCSILSSSSADGTSFSPVLNVSSGAGSCNQTPSAFVDSKGNVIVAWDADGSSLFFSHSTNQGLNFSAPVSIPTNPSPLAPQVTASVNGTIYIVWQAGSVESFARSTDGGATFSDAGPTFVLGPSVVVDSCDNVTVLGTGNKGVVQYQRSTDGGVTFSAPITISDFTFNYELQMTLDKSGNVHIVWGVDGPPRIEYVRIPTTCFVQ